MAATLSCGPYECVHQSRAREVRHENVVHQQRVIELPHFETVAMVPLSWQQLETLLHWRAYCEVDPPQDDAELLQMLRRLLADTRRANGLSGNDDP